MVLQDRSRDVGRLVAAWHESYPKRAMGGTWALRGFSFQSAVYLFEFYKSLLSGGELPAVEVLSDILCPGNREAVIAIQVKRRLTQSALRETLHEFELIRQLCSSSVPELLSHLRLQIVCKERDETLTVSPHIATPDREEFIKVAADPLEDLHALLWLHGITDPQSVIQKAAGRMLIAFDQVAAASLVQHDLVSIYENAPRRPAGPRTGNLVTADLVRLDEAAAVSRRVVVGGGFGFREIREGYFRPRPKIFARLIEEFSAWLSDNYARMDERRIPVFWIDGRSGEGKSVLLRQLVADVLLNNAGRLPVMEVAREDVPRALGEHRDPAARATLLMTDDLYAIRNREAWSDEAERHLEFDLSQVWLLTCGPTEQREEFENRFTHPIEVRRFTVPMFDIDELEEFIEWFMNRTGRTVSADHLTRENTLLVQAIFEMSEGTSLQEFARRFRRRLIGCGMEQSVRRILAINALYIPAPLAAIAHELPVDGLARLSADDQRHFTMTKDTVAFAHAHLAGEILKPMLQASFPQASWEVSWARALSIYLRPTEPQDAIPQSVIAALVTTPRLDEASRSQTLVELYRLCISDNGGVAPHIVMSRWLEVLHRLPQLVLEPSPIDATIAHLKDTSATDRPHPSVVCWLWVLADRVGLRRVDVEDLCWTYLTTSEQSRNVQRTIGFVLARTTDRTLRHKRVLQLVADGSVLEYLVIVPALAAFPDDPVLWKVAVDWFEQNPGHRDAGEILRVLIARCPAREVPKWISIGVAHAKTPAARGREGVLGALLNKSGASRECIDLAIDFCLNLNERKEQRDSVLFNLAKACTLNPTSSMAYLAVCDVNNRKREIARAIATGVKRRPECLRSVLRALETQSSDRLFGVLGQMVRLGVTGPLVIDLAAQALVLHRRRPGYMSFLRNLARQPSAWNAVLSRNPLLRTDLEGIDGLSKA
jgi:hypothetical protein